MGSRRWFHELRARLVSQGLPPQYVHRFLEELTDHFHDLKEESMSQSIDPCARLGEPQQVAEAAALAYRRRSRIGRHPVAAFLVFAVSPLLSLVAGGVAGLFLLTAAARGLGFIDEDGHHFGATAAAYLPYLLSATTIVLPAALLTALYYRVARWTGISRGWILVSCLVLSVLTGLAICQVTLSDIPGQSSLTVGLGVPPDGHVLQALVPLTLGVWLWRRTRSPGWTQPADGEVTHA